MTALPGEFHGLRGELLTLFHRDATEPLREDEFNDLALRVFRFQCRENPAYGSFVKRRGVDPEGVEAWQAIPFLPTRAFKTRPLVAGDPKAAQRIFRTSGTTQGRAERGEHHVLDLDLYREALLPPFRSHLLPDGPGLPVLNLLPSPDEAPESSLSFMMGEVLGRLAGGEGGFFVDSRGVIRTDPFLLALREAAERGTPVLLAGTAFSFVHWLDQAEGRGWQLTLPPGSRIMETGGFKGRSRVLSREELYERLEGGLGVPRGMIVNEYGMTELLSQFYEPTLALDLPGLAERRGEGRLAPEAEEEEFEGRYHRGPPWVRTQVLDPLKLSPLGPGEIGILAHLDLANLGSVSAILTEDLGRAVSGGFRLLGRASGAEPRGCSLAMEDFLGAPEGEA